jgi:hypothetical protein
MAIGGKRPGAGRKKGTLNQATLDRIKVNEHIRQRTLRVADMLFEKQLSLARGQAFLYRIDKVWKTPPSGKGGWWANKKPVLVEDPDEIASYLEGQYDAVSEDDGGASYYYITTREPSGVTIAAMYDRALGRVPQGHELTGADGGPIEITGVQINVRKR